MPKVKSKFAIKPGGKYVDLRPSASLTELEDFENTMAVASISNQDVRMASLSCSNSMESVVSNDHSKDKDMESEESMEVETEHATPIHGLDYTKKKITATNIQASNINSQISSDKSFISSTGCKNSSNTDSVISQNIKTISSKSMKMSGCKRGADTISDAPTTKKHLTRASKVTNLNANVKNNSVTNNNINSRSLSSDNIGQEDTPVTDGKSLLKDNRYSKSNKGPYIVYVQPNDDSAQSGIDALTVARILNRYMRIEPLGIKKVGKNRAAVELKSGEVANNLVASKFLLEKGLFAYIPSIYVARFGVIKNIPTEIEIDEIQEFLRSPVKLISAKRLNRKIRSSNSDNEYSFSPSKSIMLKFEDQILPKQISLFSLIYEVFPYIPRVLQCFRCFRFGYINKNCKGSAICARCGEAKHTDISHCSRVNLPPICINCKGEHLPIDTSCPTVINQRQIQALASTNNLSLMEAKLLLRNDNNSSIRYNPILDYRNFPLIPTRVPHESINSGESPGLYPHLLSSPTSSSFTRNINHGNGYSNTPGAVNYANKVFSSSSKVDLNPTNGSSSHTKVSNGKIPTGFKLPTESIKAHKTDSHTQRIDNLPPKSLFIYSNGNNPHQFPNGQALRGEKGGSDRSAFSRDSSITNSTPNPNIPYNNNSDINSGTNQSSIMFLAKLFLSWRDRILSIAALLGYKSECEFLFSIISNFIQKDDIQQ